MRAEYRVGKKRKRGHVVPKRIWAPDYYVGIDPSPTATGVAIYSVARGMYALLDSYPAENVGGVVVAQSLALGRVGHSSPRIVVTIEDYNLLPRFRTQVSAARMIERRIKSAFPHRNRIIRAPVNRWRRVVLGKQRHGVDWKDLARWYATAILCAEVIDHNIAEAVCIGEYGRNVHENDLKARGIT